MPQPIFGNQHQGLSLQPNRVVLSTAGKDGKLLLIPRSARYLTAVGRLDASTTMSAVEMAEVIDTIHREFAEKWAPVPLGFVGHCYLGPPYEAHTLTVDGQIIEHYQCGQALPAPLEQARSLARTEHYLVIEVYSNRLVCVRADGSVVPVGG